MKGFTFRVYPLILLALTGLLVTVINRKILKDSEEQRSNSPLQNLLTTNTFHPVRYRRNESTPQVQKQQITGQEDIIQTRLRLVNDMCRTLNRTSGVVSELTGNRDLKFVHCVVPKAGCTMWLRILQYIAGQRGRTDHPMSLDKYDIHYHPHSFRQTFSFNNKDKAFIKNAFRSMTVRHPYTRLWSAYIDKLLLPDFWQTKGKAIIKMVRHNPEEDSLRCGYDVTFAEFIEYVIRTGHSFEFINQDKHWLPASDICDPCTFRPDMVSKQETFLADLKYTTNHIGISYIFEKLVTKDPVVFEIEDEVAYQFKIYSQHSGCVDVNQLCQRIWRAFQYNGYIPPMESFHSHVKSPRLTKNSFLSVIHDVRKTFRVTNADKKQWRKDAMKQAFKTLTESQKNALVDLYKTDFQLFAYDNQVPDKS